jgi:hypothetical protein
MYKYLLTDGMSNFIACELEHLSGIEIRKTLPGSKLRLHGPIEVRRGIWMLRKSNVELLYTA